MPETEKQTKPDARALATRMLELILIKHQPLDEVWEATPDIRTLEPRDQRFCRLLILTALRNLGFIDATLDKYLPRRADIPNPVQMILRLGVVQLLFLKTPPHAAVNSCLESITHAHAHVKGVVNAVLRKISTEEKAPDDVSESWKQNIPSWLQQSWAMTYGAERYPDICKASLTEPTLDITVKGNAEIWAGKLGAKILPNGTLRLEAREDVRGLEGFDEGAWWVQDCAAALPAKLLGDIKGKIVYDLCAAPGGKTAQLANMGGHVTSVERSKTRVTRLIENCTRLKLDARTVLADALKFTPSEKADAVLLDAPCTATGTIRRHPDLMHLKSQEDVNRLSKTQSALLEHAAILVKPDGVLVYAVCFLQPEEGVRVVDGFLKTHPEWQRVPAKAEELGGAECAELINQAGDIRTMPCHWRAFGGMDGFYASRLRRKT